MGCNQQAMLCLELTAVRSELASNNLVHHAFAYPVLLFRRPLSFLRILKEL